MAVIDGFQGLFSCGRNPSGEWRRGGYGVANETARPCHHPAHAVGGHRHPARDGRFKPLALPLVEHGQDRRLVLFGGDQVGGGGQVVGAVAGFELEALAADFEGDRSVQDENELLAVVHG